MSEIKNGRLGLYGAEHSKCNRVMSLDFKELSRIDELSLDFKELSRIDECSISDLTYSDIMLVEAYFCSRRFLTILSGPQKCNDLKSFRATLFCFLLCISLPRAKAALTSSVLNSVFG